MQADKILSLLGLARKAGKLCAGYDLSVEKIREGKAELAFAAADISSKTFKNLSFEADRQKVRAVRLPCGQKELGAACGVRAGVGVLLDAGFAQAILRKMNDLQKEEYGL